MQLAELESKTLHELQDMARELKIENYTKFRKRELVFELLKVLAVKEGLIFSQGILEILPDGYGFLRVEDFCPGPDDIYVSASQIRRFNLRTGDLVSGQVRPPKDNEKYFALLRVQAVNMLDPDSLKRRNHFEELTPIYPQERIRLETESKEIASG
jgi:transcription termination factor Rho